MIHSLRLQTTSHDQAPLVNAIQNAFHRPKSQNSRLTSICLTAFKGLLVLTCAAGAATFIGVAKRFANDNFPLYVACATASMITYTTLDYWAYSKWMNVSKTPPIDILHNPSNFSSKCLLTAFKIFTLLAGGIAMLPLAYVAYEDNKDSFIAFSLLLAAASGIPAYSLLMSMQSKAPSCSSGIERKLEKCQKKLCALLTQRNFHFLKQSRSEQLSFFQKLTNSINYKDYDNINRILKKLFLIQTTQQQTPSSFRPFGAVAAQAVGFASAIARLALFGTIAYRAGSSLFDGDSTKSIVSGISATTLVIASTTYITLDVLMSMAKRTYESTLSFFRCQRTHTLASQLHPYTSFLKIPLNVLLASLTLAPMLPFTDEYLPKSTPYPLALVDKILFGCATFLLYFNALRDISDQVLAHPTFTTVDGKKIICVHKGIQLIEETIKNSSLLNIALFLEVLPQKLFEKVTDSLNLTKEEIHAYVKDHNTPDLDEEEILLGIEQI